MTCRVPSSAANSSWLKHLQVKLCVLLVLCCLGGRDASLCHVSPVLPAGGRRLLRLPLPVLADIFLQRAEQVGIFTPRGKCWLLTEKGCGGGFVVIFSHVFFHLVLEFLAFYFLLYFQTKTRCSKCSVQSLIFLDEIFQLFPPLVQDWKLCVLAGLTELMWDQGAVKD